MSEFSFCSSLPGVDNLWNPLDGEPPSDFEEDFDPVDEEEDDHDEHQARVAPVEDVTVELVVLTSDDDEFNVIELCNGSLLMVMVMIMREWLKMTKRNDLMFNP